ncbi:MAG TPA: DUF222 domain-containing protein [Acidimicrobiia bacterium]|nr:DUF222 domain-containing protein [Acidimicrobiia bacterium]
MKVPDRVAGPVADRVAGLVRYPEVASGEAPFECSNPVAETTCRLQFLELLSPGVLLGRALASIDRGELNGHDLVHLLRGRRRQVAWLEAECLADMVELGHCPPSVPGSPPVRTQVMEDHVADELKMALVWTRRAAESTLDVAWQLVERLPRVWEALREGRIDLARARVIASGVAHLDEVVAGEVADRVLGEAEELTTGQIRARLGRLCVEVDPDDARRRYEEGLERRRLTSELGEGGTADLLGENLPADRAAAIVSHIHEEALRRRRGGDTRSMDQLRADIFLELLEGSGHQGSGRRPVVDIRVDLETLVGLAERAGEIPGWGPVIADIARRLVDQQPDGEWRVTVTDPDTGAVLADGTTRRRPTAAQRRYLEARQTTCSNPRCRMPAHRSDIDHNHRWAQGGDTEVENLAPACRHDHMLLTVGGWTLQQPQVGVYVWTTRHGFRYTHRPRPP